MTTIIGITGRKFHGKSTLAKLLVERENFVEISLADPLKQCLKGLFHFTDAQLYGDEKEIVDPRWGVDPRKVMQFVGSEMFRDMMPTIIPDLGNNFWVKIMEENIKILREKNPDIKIVVSDVRFPNEIDAVKGLGGKNVRVLRPNIVDNIGHISEILIDNLKVDAEINNCGTIEDMYYEYQKLHF